MTLSLRIPSLAALALAGASVALAVPRAGPASGAATGDSGGGDAPAAPSYDRDVRPLLAERCLKCHGADAAAREADLRLDVRDSAIADRKTGAPIVPGKPDASELWRRVSSDDPEVRMPPPQSRKPPLTAGERDLLRRWIEEGAPYEKHWAFVAPRRPPLPAVRNEAWPRNEVDRFVLARLERDGIAPSPEADKPTLLRRLFLDLTGLPPTPEEIDAFVADARADAYERWVDRLFTEEPYRTRHAERMAAPWLDAARYADTSGIHTDAGRSIWPWRDWVLAAFRENKPFDAFLIEQLAGDLLPDPTLAQRVATGFNRNHVTSDEGGAIADEYLVEYAVDRVATTGSVFLGLTVGCARCHDHKFDPISQEDFYKLFAFFDSVDEPGLYSQEGDPKRAFEPFLEVPSTEQAAERARIRGELTKLKAELDQPIAGEDAERGAFFAELARTSALDWPRASVVSAKSAGGAVLEVQPDGSVFASGASPAADEHEIVLRTEGAGLRVLSVEALADPRLPDGRVGRAFNGNAVLTGVEAEAVSVRDPSQRAVVHFEWAWADHEQKDGDHRAVNVLNAADALGWAVAGHQKPGGRVLLCLAREPFGFEGGTELRVKLGYKSPYAAHVLGRVRLGVASLGDAALARLPLAASDWYRVGPFPAADGGAAFTTAFGPEADAALDLAKNFGAGNQYWRHQIDLADGALHALPDGVNATYVGRRVFAPTARRVELSLGSDDGLRVLVNGKEVLSHEVNRPLARDQEKVAVDLRAGENVIVMKIVNTGGKGGFFYRPLPGPDELAGDLLASLLAERDRSPDLQLRLARAWRMRFSPGYRERVDAIASRDARLGKLDAEIPRTMVMKELAKPRDTFVLSRGRYDQPDKKRPVARAAPAALGAWPKDAPANRLGLAQWMLAPENPLVARVEVNRIWELVFGAGLVRSTEDFGLRGEWPSHPELLDWLAVELREGGWNVQAILRRLVTSATYRQSSRARADLRERDPENRLLAAFPRQRLGAEQIRDQALFAGGLLVEQLGGPSVKPYQPPGLWEEVAMPASNTRLFKRDSGAALWRRSLYTYWKRACPPPSLMALDAPTRESCVVRRSTTNTPLQALVLWNDEQLVEAARSLAQRTLAERPDGADAAAADRERVTRIVRRCTGRAPDGAELDALLASLAGLRERYRAAPDDAKKLIAVGESPVPAGADASELAAWTLLANAVLSLDASISKN